jgi:Fe-S cluster biogenesis protein NfuA
MIGMVVKAEIEEAVTEVRPWPQADGGDIELVTVGDDVEVRLEGACTGCLMAQMTIRNSVENYLKKGVQHQSRGSSVKLKTKLVSELRV